VIPFEGNNLAVVYYKNFNLIWFLVF